MNYRQYRVACTTDLLDSDFRLTCKGLPFRMRGIGYYDPANVRFEDNHNNTLYQPAQTPRNSRSLGVFASQLRQMAAYGQYTFALAGHDATFALGQQTVRWGESALIAINSLSEINPPSSAFLHMPGAQINQSESGHSFSGIRQAWTS
jgi:hypothetical protein